MLVPLQTKCFRFKMKGIEHFVLAVHVVYHENYSISHSLHFYSPLSCEQKIAHQI